MSLWDALRADAGETLFFERELEYRKAQSYDVLRAPLRGMELLPVTSEAGAGAETITYEQYDHTGVAKIIANYGDDLPRADVKGLEFTANVRSIGNSFGYSVQEIRAAMMAGKSLEQRKANAAIRSMQEQWNRILFYGNADSKLQGWLTNPNIPTVAPTEESSDGSWFDASGNLRKSATQILADMNNLANSIPILTNGAERPRRLVLPIQHYTATASTNAGTGTDTTILQYFIRNNPYIEEVEWANELTEAQLTANGVSGSGSGQLSGNVMIAYDPNPDKVTFEMPVPFEQLPVQERNMEFVVPCHSRVGGVIIYYPLSMAVMEDI